MGGRVFQAQGVACTKAQWWGLGRPECRVSTSMGQGKQILGGQRSNDSSMVDQIKEYGLDRRAIAIHRGRASHDQFHTTSIEFKIGGTEYLKGLQGDRNGDWN